MKKIVIGIRAVPALRQSLQDWAKAEQITLSALVTSILLQALSARTPVEDVKRKGSKT